MSLKSFAKTRWKIEADQVTTYPYGISLYLGIFLTLAYGALFFYIFKNEYLRNELGPFSVMFLIIAILFYGNAATDVVFDNRTKRMKKRLFGLITLVSIPFEELQGINPVSNTGGGYNYRAFKKSNRYGKGTTISSGYVKKDDPNAIAFVSGPVAVIHGFLSEGQVPEINMRVPLTSFKFFDEDNGVYTLKKNKTGSIILGVVLAGLGAWLGVSAFKNNDGSSSSNTFAAFALIFFGVIFILSVFTTLTFDAPQKLVTRKGFVSSGNKQYHFNDFTGFRTVRRTTNFVYSGTELQMFFRVPDKQKEVAVQIMTVRNTKHIDRVIQEINQIMGM